MPLTCVRFFRMTLGTIVTHLFSMVSFFVFTCPNQSGVGAIDDPGWFEQLFDPFFHKR
eukprot:UN12995